MLVLPRLSELIPWSIWDYLPKTAMGTDVFLIGGNPFQIRGYAAWHVRPLGTIEHTKRFMVKKAICNNEIEDLAEVLDDGFDLEENIDKDYGYTALTLAAALNRNSIVKYLLLRGAQIEGKDGRGQTPLMRATAFWQVETLLSLLSCGANIYETDSFGFNCLEKARLRGLKAVERLLLDNYKSEISLPKFVLRFQFESSFEDVTAVLYKEKKYIKGKFVPYPFNDVEGNYHFSMLFVD